MKRSFVSGLATLAIALSLVGCGTSVVGTWKATKVPFLLGFTMDPTLTFDEKNNLKVDIAVNSGATSVLTAVATGKYKLGANDLELTFDTQIAAKDGSGAALPTQTSDTGAQCITFAGAVICFPSPQKSAYQIQGDKMNVIIKYKVGDEAEASLPIQVTKGK